MKPYGFYFGASSIILFIGGIKPDSNCTISINKDLSDPQPLLVQKGYFALPNGDKDEIILKPNRFIEAGCGGQILVNDISIDTNVAQFKCVKGAFLTNDGKSAPFNAIRCSKCLKPVLEFTGKCLNGTYDEFKIGYYHRNKFLVLITGCFDKKDVITLYTVHKISKHVNGRQLSYPRPNWIQGDVYNLTGVNKLYSRKKQRLTINSLLDLEPSSTKYISENNFYLIHGHLSPKADFIYGSQQNATFHLVNSVPQWHFINLGNWRTLEANLRDFAVERKIDLTIYTGTYNNLKLPNKSGKKWVDLYLSVDGSKKMIPIPEYIWKIAQDHRTKAGVAFVSLNNPYTNDSTVDICDNICSKLHYLTLNNLFSLHGYVYCCDVNDLRQTVKDIPNFITKTLLK